MPAQRMPRCGKIKTSELEAMMPEGAPAEDINFVEAPWCAQSMIERFEPISCPMPCQIHNDEHDEEGWGVELTKGNVDLKGDKVDLKKMKLKRLKSIPM